MLLLYEYIEPPEVSMADVLDMIDDDDLKHLKGKEFKDRQYLVSSGEENSR
jgi:hypothetical protein